MNVLLRAALAVLIIGNCQVFAQQRRSVEMPEQINDALVHEDGSVRKCIEVNGGVNRTFRTEAVNLNQDSFSEIMVHGISPCVCGPKKCVNRIYQKTGTGYELLFKADYAQEIELRKYYANGYRNLWAAVYMYGSFTSVLYEYKYDGKQYRWDNCAMRFYVYAEFVKGVPFSGRVRYHSRPQISAVGCDPP
jgi:hypothetical protein